MAGKVLNYELEFWDNGVSKISVLEIPFISHSMIREFNKISQTVYEIQAKYDSLSDVITLIASDEGEETKEELIVERDKIIKSFSVYNEEEILDRRFELTKKILEKNGITDERLLTFEFWDENVQPIDYLNFLETCISKDIDKKKLM